MALTKPYVTIKGTKDGLTFHLDDQCTYDQLMSELSDKLHKYDPHVLEGPFVQVSVQLGWRYLTDEQKAELKNLIRAHGNLIVNNIQSSVVPVEEVEKARLDAEVRVLYRTVRSGQVLTCDGDVIILGDINPGGCLRSEGHIFVMGALRGMAHAGYKGRSSSIIAASLLQPTQLRIADKVSRPPDEWESSVYEREFAYIHDKQIVIEKLSRLAYVRPELQQAWNALSKGEE